LPIHIQQKQVSEEVGSVKIGDSAGIYPHSTGQSASGVLDYGISASCNKRFHDRDQGLIHGEVLGVVVVEDYLPSPVGSVDLEQLPLTLAGARGNVLLLQPGLEFLQLRSV
jgi:hypothetical protein